MRGLVPPPLVVAAALAAGCARGALEIPEGTQRMLRVRMLQTESGRAAWELEADQADIQEASEEVRLERPVFRIHQKDRDTTRIQARTGRFRTDSHDIAFEGRVIAASLRDATTLYTEALAYSMKDGRIWTDDPVRIVRPDGTVRGRGFTAKPDMSEMTILKQEARIL